MIVPKQFWPDYKLCVVRARHFIKFRISADAYRCIPMDTWCPPYTLFVVVRNFIVGIVGGVVVGAE